MLDVFQFSGFFQLSKTNVQFHKLFKEVSRDEALTQSTSAAAVKKLPVFRV